MKRSLAVILALASLSTLAWTGPKVTRDAKAKTVKRTWAEVKASIADSVGKTSGGYFAYSRKFNDLGPIDTSGTLTDTELETQFAMACVLASPITVNGAKVKPQLEKWLADKALMNAHSDFVARQGHVVADRDGTLVVQKYLWGMNGSENAVAFYNPTECAKIVKVTREEICLDGKVRWTDRMNPARKGVFEGEIAVEVPSHGTRFYHLSGKPRMRTTYRSECAEKADDGKTLVYNCVFVPKNAKYDVEIVAKAGEKFKVIVGGLPVGEYTGTAKFTTFLHTPENSIRIVGATTYPTLKVLNLH